MKAKSTTSVIVAMLLAAVLAVGFWVLVLGPKRDEAAKLGTEVSDLQTSLAQHRTEADAAAQARDEFPAAYQGLVVLGKAVPGDDDTASLLVELNRIAERADVQFQDITLKTGTGETGVAPLPETSASPSSAAASEPVSATEAAAATLPLGASIGPAGLAVMPYTLTFKGDFFELADFIHGLDSLVKTKNAKVLVDGRLITVDGFSLTADPNGGFPALEASFAVTTYLTPPSQGVTGGASPEAPPSTATQVSTTVGGTP